MKFLTTSLLVSDAIQMTGVIRLSCIIVYSGNIKVVGMQENFVMKEKEVVKILLLVALYQFRKGKLHFL